MRGGVVVSSFPSVSTGFVVRCYAIEDVEPVTLEGGNGHYKNERRRGGGAGGQSARTGGVADEGGRT